MGNAVRMRKILIFLAFLLATIVVLFSLSFGVTAIAETTSNDDGPFETLKVRLVLNGGSIDCVETSENGIIELELGEEELVLPLAEKAGFEFLGWTKSGDADDFDYISSLSSESEISTLFAKFELKAPEIEIQPNDYNGVYGEGGHILSVEATHGGGIDLSIQWYKDGVAIENATMNELKVSNVKDSGFYFAVVKVTIDGETRVTLTRTAVVRIQKAKLTSSPDLILEGVYSPEKTLSDYPLSENFKWVDDGVTPTPNTRKYPAIFNVDSDNYLDFECMVVLIIQKAEQEIYAEDFTKVYDGMPASITATTSGNSILEYSDNNTLTNVGREAVVVTAPETDLYLRKSVVVILEILPQEVEIVWSNLSFVYNQQEQCPTADAVDKEGFIVELDVYANGINAGVHQANATPRSKNYTITNPTVEYVIEKADYNSDLILFEDKKFVYDGKPHSLSVENLPEWISVSLDSNPTEVGVHKITATFMVMNENYNQIEPKTAFLTILQSSFKGDWYEIFCPEGVEPDIELSLELIDNLDGLFVKNSGKFKYVLGFRVVSSDNTIYKKPMIIRFNYENVGIENLVLSVDRNANEKVLTYKSENGVVEFSVDSGENVIVLAERTKSIVWLIVLVIGACIAVSVALYFILYKKSEKKEEKSHE